MAKCEICKYQNDCPDIVEENTIYCLTHRKIPKNFGNEYIEKQQLISFLEDKIYRQELLLKDWKMDTYNYNYQKGIQFAYQEVLDFVNKGGKE